MKKLLMIVLSVLTFASIAHAEVDCKTAFGKPVILNEDAAQPNIQYGSRKLDITGFTDDGVATYYFDGGVFTIDGDDGTIRINGFNVSLTCNND